MYILHMCVQVYFLGESRVASYRYTQLSPLQRAKVSKRALNKSTDPIPTDLTACVSFLPKPRHANLASKWLLFIVNCSLMFIEKSFRCRFVVAIFTFERSLLIVYSRNVSVHMNFLSESSFTNWALERSNPLIVRRFKE